MPSAHFPSYFCPFSSFCNRDHCHLVEIFTTWIGIGLVTVRTHLESRLSGSMGRVISLSSIRPSVYFCLHRWCAASSVSAVRHIEPPPDPSILESHQGKSSQLSLPLHADPPLHFYQLETGSQGPLAYTSASRKTPPPFSFSPSYCNINICRSAAISLALPFKGTGLIPKDEFHLIFINESI